MNAQEFNAMVDSLMEKDVVDLDNLTNILKRDSAIIEFEKKNGDLRVMNATINLKKIPKDKRPKKEMKKPEYILTVFDLDKKDWRSMRIFSIKKVSFKNKIFKFKK